MERREAVAWMRRKRTCAARLARSSSEPVSIIVFTPDHSSPLALMGRLIMVSVLVNSAACRRDGNACRNPMSRPTTVPYSQYKIANSASNVKTPKNAAKAPTENAVVRRKAIVAPQSSSGKMGAKNQR